MARMLTDRHLSSVPPLLVNARMYSVSPATAEAWLSVLQWVLRQARLPWSVIDHPAPKSLADLWARPDLGCTLMCGLPYMLSRKRAIPLAAPIVRAARYRGRPIYFTDIVVRASTPFKTLEDTFGGRVGYPTKESQSGYVALREHLMPYRQARGSALFAEVIGPLISPRGIVKALLENRIDVGPLDSYAHDLIRHVEPELGARLRTVEVTRPAPIPLFVATAPLPQEQVRDLRQAFLQVARAEELRSVGDILLLEDFVVPNENEYRIFHKRSATSDAYPDEW
jgi:ABC-type phosphate/phosphonate transport system substrate-binding protein